MWAPRSVWINTNTFDTFLVNHKQQQQHQQHCKFRINTDWWRELWSVESDYWRFYFCHSWKNRVDNIHPVLWSDQGPKITFHCIMYQVFFGPVDLICTNFAFLGEKYFRLVNGPHPFPCVYQSCLVTTV